MPSAASDPLAALRGLHLPPPVEGPLVAPVWLLVMVVLLIGLGGSVWLYRRRLQTTEAVALRELSHLESEALSLQEFATRLSELLRRVAVKQFGHRGIANLHGRAWQEFLENHFGAPSATMAPSFHALAEAPYMPADAPSSLREIPVERTTLARNARAWIRRNT